MASLLTTDFVICHLGDMSNLFLAYPLYINSNIILSGRNHLFLFVWLVFKWAFKIRDEL